MLVKTISTINYWEIFGIKSNNKTVLRRFVNRVLAGRLENKDFL